MKNIIATTYVLCPAGTNIEYYTDTCLVIGDEFPVRHLDTRKVVQTAKIIDVQIYRDKPRYYRIVAEII